MCFVAFDTVYDQEVVWSLAFLVGFLIVSWPSVSLSLVPGVSCRICSSCMVVRTLGLRLSSGILIV